MRQELFGKWGLFGKLPSKRDFVAIGVPAAFLVGWERWLQAGMAESRAQLGSVWLDAYLVAPLWRFWLSERIAGTAVTGVVLPSVDAVGRHFPLSAFIHSGSASAPSPCLVEEWFSRIDGVLLAGLEQRTDAAQLYAVLAGMEPCPEIARPSSGAAADEPGSVWWTSGALHPPVFTFSQHTLPDAAFFVRLLEGVVEAPPSSPATPRPTPVSGTEE